jgi:hypothetical protein
MVRRVLLATRVPVASRAWLERAVGGAAQILIHELDALSGHWAEVRERVDLARQARGLGDLVRSQADLFPETRARLALDHRERRALLHSWLADLNSGAAQSSSRVERVP